MPVQGIFGTTVELLGKTLDLRAKRQTMISANLANVETPGYTASDLSFEGQLKSALKGGPKAGALTNPRHIPLKGASAASLEKVRGDVVELNSGNMGPDGNSVEMESEMGRLAENQIMYNASVQILTKKFEELKQAIRGTL
ncbi:flagellar basal body rod protein FlgB [Geomonas nitrogeniifigens]|uniref:Flagellar basal body rod protein FlgB n=1 Tax=Geomonas diazotrophica TaxID=2843197 RepID=A0ABX8JFG6_9BACT|nr:flagellar basal body rod protein FlgB [Geomonas nitrogeniifigens]QWV97129.1 flagellar basal body rod protein FlgB [Geomonas nitrogeniifigens]QXE86301.1 flagellar basal body rod protein FlgB [Geomonas nitrogeniifigens]